MSDVDALDLFAGCGGVSLGLELLGLTDLGFELGDEECATRDAAGFLTVHADLSQLNPAEFTGAEGLWDSSPCPDFSVAGKRAGRAGKSGWLVDEKMRWIKACGPRWVGCENVPGVEPVFREQALELQAMGYRTWVGCLSAEEYGVPQTRNRCFLMAHRDHDVVPPAPTHQPYEFGVPAQTVETIFGELRPWVSMAEALGWDAPNRPMAELEAWAHDRPATTIAGDPRCFQPGGHHETGQQSEGAIQLGLHEALVLQGMPADHPVQGSRTAAFRQVGNVVCPPMAAAVVGELLGLDWRAALDEARGGR